MYIAFSHSNYTEFILTNDHICATLYTKCCIKHTHTHIKEVFSMRKKLCILLVLLLLGSSLVS